MKLTGMAALDDSQSHGSSCDSEAEELEARMYSNLYFDPNPDYVPIPSSEQSQEFIFETIPCLQEADKLKVDASSASDETPQILRNGNCVQNPAVGRQKLTKNKNSLESPSDSKKKQKNERMVKKQLSKLCTTNDTIESPKPLKKSKSTSEAAAPPPARKRRQRLLSNSSVQSIPGSVVLDGLYCLPDTTIPEEESIIDSELDSTAALDAQEKVDSWNCTPQQDKGKLLKTKCQNKRKSTEMTDFIEKDRPRRKKEKNVDVIVIDSESEQNSSVISVQTAKNSAVKKPIKKINKPESLREFIMQFQKKAKVSKPNSIKQDLQANKKNRLLKKAAEAAVSAASKTEFIMDLSGESCDESTLENSKLLTNLSLCHNVTSQSNTSILDRVYDGSEVTRDTDTEHTNDDRPKKKKQKRTHWPMDYTIGRPPTKKLPLFAHWTPQMTSFYESDFSDEYDLDEVHRKMPSNVIEWELEEEDLPYQVLRRNSTGVRQKRRYFKGTSTRCTRCRSFDHVVAQCSKLDYCHLCGNTDHSSRENCPSNRCLRCGEGPHTFCQKATLWTTCELCHKKGHVKSLCPDVWRRFCFTVSGNTPVPPSAPLPSTISASSSRSSKKQSCCTCGRSGHIGPDCHQKTPCYIVLPYDVVSYEPPTRDLLGLTVLNVTAQEEDDDEQQEQSVNPYGEYVVVHTPSRATVMLSSNSVGLIIGKKGVVINTLQKLSRCKLCVRSVNNKDQLWVNGEDIDLVIRAVLFLLQQETDLTGIEQYMEALDCATGTTVYTEKYRRKLRQEQHRMSQQALQAKKNLKDIVKLKDCMDKSKEGNGRNSSRGENLNVSRQELDKSAGEMKGRRTREDSIVLVSDSDSDSDLQIISDSDDTDEQTKNFSHVIKKEECDSKYDAIEQLVKKGSRAQQKKLQVSHAHLTDSENSNYDSDESSSGLDSAMEDYADNFLDESSGGYASSDGSDSSDSSDCDGERSCYNFDCDLNLTPQVLDKVKDMKKERRYCYLQMVPEGRQSAITVLTEKLDNLKNMNLNVLDVVAEVKEHCLQYNRSPDPSVLSALQDKLKQLGRFVLGTKQTGYGKDLIQAMEKKLLQLKNNSSAARVSAEDRAALANTLLELFEVDVDDLQLILVLAAELTGSKKPPSGLHRKRAANNTKTPKRQQQFASTPISSTPVNNRRSLRKRSFNSSFQFDQATPNSSMKRNFSHRLSSSKNLKKSRNSSMFNSINEGDNFGSDSQSADFIGLFTRTPKGKKLKKNAMKLRKEHQKANRNKSNRSDVLKNNLENRIQFPSPNHRVFSTDSPQGLSPRNRNLNQGSNRSPMRRTSRSPGKRQHKSPASQRSKSTKNNRKSKSPSKKYSQPSPSRTSKSPQRSRREGIGGGGKASRSKGRGASSKSPRRRQGKNH